MTGTPTINWWVDAASFAVHPDLRSHTGATVSLGKGSIYNKSSKQKINTRSSTEAEVVGVNDAMTMILWMQLILDALEKRQRCPGHDSTGVCWYPSSDDIEALQASICRMERQTETLYLEKRQTKTSWTRFHRSVLNPLWIKWRIWTIRVIQDMDPCPWALFNVSSYFGNQSVITCSTKCFNTFFHELTVSTLLTHFCRLLNIAERFSWVARD